MKRLSPERIAEITRLAVHSDSILPCELLGHIEAIEAELKATDEIRQLEYQTKKDAILRLEACATELAEAKAELSSTINLLNLSTAESARIQDEMSGRLEEAKAEIARLNSAFESAVSAHNTDYARLVEEHKQTLEEFAAYIKECEG